MKWARPKLAPAESLALPRPGGLLCPVMANASLTLLAYWGIAGLGVARGSSNEHRRNDCRRLAAAEPTRAFSLGDRKSTRLNSSH